MTWIICLIEEKIQLLAQDERPAEELSALFQSGKWLPQRLNETLKSKLAWQAIVLGENLLLVYPQQEQKKAANSAPEYPPLTPRQQAVLQLLTEGLTAKQIAARMGLSRRTVFLHLAAIRQRLGVSSTIQAVWKMRGKE